MLTRSFPPWHLAPESAAGKVRALDPQPHAFHQTQATAIEESYDQAINASELGHCIAPFQGTQ